MATTMVHCRSCGKEIHESAVQCPQCGAPQQSTPTVPASDKRILPALLLCFFFGTLGVHRFYVGKVGTGILQLVTLGGLGVWTLIDFILIICGVFTDAQGNKITEWT